MGYEVIIKDEDGQSVYKLDKIEDIDLVIKEHPNYDSLEAKQEKNDEKK